MNFEENLSNGSITLEPYLETQSVLTYVDTKVDLSRGPYSNPVYTMEDNLKLFIPKGKGKASMILTYPGGQSNTGKFASWGRQVYKVEENFNKYISRY